MYLGEGFGLGTVGELCGALADVIEESPVVAAKVARKLSTVLLSRATAAEQRLAQSREEEFKRLDVERLDAQARVAGR